MNEPTTNMLIAAAASGAAIKALVEKAWGAGEKLLKRFFEHEPAAIAKAEENVRDFVDRLGEKVAALEEKREIDDVVLDAALDDPSFAGLLRTAMIHSAQTASGSKHDLLARLVAEKLTTPSESLKANVLPLACNAVAHLDVSQLAPLAIHAVLRFGSPVFSREALFSESQFFAECNARLEILLAPFLTIPFTYQDLLHLQATGCGAIHAMTVGDNEGLKCWKAGPLKLTWPELIKLPVMVQTKAIWARTMVNFEPSTIGEVVGLSALESAGSSELGVSTWRDWRAENS